MDLAELRSELQVHLGITSADPQFPTSVLDNLLNRSFWEILDKFPFREKETSVTFPSVAGARQYEIPDDTEALSMISVLNPATNKHNKLNRIDKTQYENEYNEDTSTQTLPYSYYREESTIYLFPTPDQVYTFTLKYKKNLADLFDSVETPDVPRIWWEVILYGGVYRGYLRRGDFPRSNEFRNVQINLINSTESVESKEEDDSKLAGVFAMRPPYRV